MTPVSTKSWVIAAVALLLGFSAVPALAAPFLYYDIRMADGIGNAAIVDDLHPSVLLNLYVFVRSATPDGIPANDRWAFSTGAIKSSDSSVDPLHKLMGNLSSSGATWAAGLNAGISKVGTNGKSLDTDPDFDVGYKATGDSYFTASVGAVTSPSEVNTPVLGEEIIGGVNYLKFLIASNIEFTFMGIPILNDSTVVKYAPRAAAATQKAYVDGVYKSLHGGTVADVGVGDGVTVTYMPEPATMVLLGLGGAIVAIRRRRAA